jgi:hypothetical protein
MSKKINKQNLDYERICEELISRKYLALRNWFIKKSKDGSSGVEVFRHLKEKQQSLNDGLFGGYVSCEGETVFTQDKFRAKIYAEFEKRKKLKHSKFITDTINKLPAIKKEAGSLEGIDETTPTKIVKGYAYYRAYEIFFDALKEIAENQSNVIIEKKVSRLANELVNHDYFDKEYLNPFIEVYKNPFNSKVEQFIIYNKSEGSLKILIEDSITTYKLLPINFDQRYSFISNHFKPNPNGKNRKKRKYYKARLEKVSPSETHKKEISTILSVSCSLESHKVS